MLESLLTSQASLAKLIRFGLVGGTSTLMYGGLTYLLINEHILTPLTATLVSYVIFVPFNFLLQKYFTFRSKASHSTELPKFLLLHLLNMTGSWIIMYAATRLAGLASSWGILGAMLIVPILVYVTMNTWVFRAKSEPRR